MIDQIHHAIHHHHHHHHQIMSGVVMDIRKAFNALQRRSVFMLAKKAGAQNEAIITAWSGNLMLSSRQGLIKSTPLHLAE